MLGVTTKEAKCSKTSKVSSKFKHVEIFKNRAVQQCRKTLYYNLE